MSDLPLEEGPRLPSLSRFLSLCRELNRCLTVLAGNRPYSRPSSNSDSGHAASDLSSLAPSQSASQLNGDASHQNPSPPPKPPFHALDYRLRVPSAHSIDDHSIPNGRPNGAPRASWRISEVPEPEEEEGGGSSADEDEAGLEVRENQRYSKGKFKSKEADAEEKPFSVRPSAPAITTPSPSTEHGSVLGKRERHRSGSTGLFGRAIGALFHHRDGKEKELANSVSPGKASPTKSGQWRTRTDSNLARVWRGKAGDESSDDEGQTRQLYSTWSPNTAVPPKLAPVTLGASASTSSVHTAGKGSPTGQKLKKAKRSSVQTPPRNTQAKDAAQKGYESDSAGVRKSSFSLSRASSVSKPKGADTPTPKGKGKGKSNGDASPSAKPQRLTELALAEMNSSSISRNSSLSRQSITSAASAPARTPGRSTTAAPVVPHSASATAARSRALSLQPAEAPPTATASVSSSQMSPSASAPVGGHRRTASTSSAMPPMPHRSGLTKSNDGPSLMSIVEGVTRQNKDARTAQDPNRKLIDVRAPPPVNVDATLQGVSRADMPSQPGSSSANHASDMPTKRPSPLLRHTKMPASMSAPTLHASGSASAAKPPPKLPLRSALRNSSRTPSPNPPPAVRGTPSDSSRDVSPVRAMGTGHTSITPSRLAVVDKDDDATSISSYATGREEWEDENTPVAARTPELSPSPQPPPKNDAQGSDVSGSSTTTEGAPTRRKSVRMSLPPTFSATPPAIEDASDEETRGRHAPWGPSGQWSTRIQSAPERDVWQDSSEEDEGYSTARKLLSRMSKGRT